MLVLDGQGIPLGRGDYINLMACWPYCIVLQYLVKEHKKMSYSLMGENEMECMADDLREIERQVFMELEGMINDRKQLIFEAVNHCMIAHPPFSLMAS